MPVSMESGKKREVDANMHRSRALEEAIALTNHLFLFSFSFIYLFIFRGLADGRRGRRSSCSRTMLSSFFLICVQNITFSNIPF